MDQNLQSRKIIFIDGTCNLCNGFVDFFLKFNKNNSIFISSLQGETAQSVLNKKPEDSIYSIIYYKNGTVLEKSDAVLEIFNDSNSFLKIFYFFKFIPLKLRNICYDLVAANRYRFFGQKDSCRLPTPQEKQHFLD